MEQNTNSSFVTRVTERETVEFFHEGLCQAAGAARQLAILQQHEIWSDVSKLLDEIHNNGMKMILAKPLSRTDVLSMLDKRESRTLENLDKIRKPKLIVN